MTDQIPKFRALAQRYRDLVYSGKLEAGTQLDSRRKLAKEHQTSRVTIDKVMELLTAEGIIEPSDGNRPPVVADVSSKAASVQNRVRNAAANGRALAKNEKTKILSAKSVPCPVDVAPLLGVQPGEKVLRRERLNLVDDKPVATGYSYYPPEVTELTPELRKPVSMPSGSRELAAERMGSPQKEVFTTPLARLATDRERELLKLGGTYVVVLQLSRQVLLEDGRTVEVAVKVVEGTQGSPFHTTL